MKETKTRGRPKGAKTGVKYLTIKEIVDKFGIDCKINIPVSKKWWDNLM